MSADLVPASAAAVAARLTPEGDRALRGASVTRLKPLPPVIGRHEF